MLFRSGWPGRFDVRSVGDRRLVLDGAHNPGGARALAASLAEYFPGAELTLVAGILRDKDARGILAPLAPLAGRLILTGSSNPRAADPEALREALPTGSPAAEVARSTDEALALVARSPRTPIVCVAGSLSLVGDVLRRGLGGDKPCSLEKGADSMEFLF